MLTERRDNIFLFIPFLLLIFLNLIFSVGEQLAAGGGGGGHL
jgi:hypothetical protein